MSFPQSALLLAAVWLAAVAIKFRRSTPVLVGGLVVVGGYALAALVWGAVTPTQLGLGPRQWTITLVFALLWVALMLGYSPIADWLASRFVAQPPTLKTFRAIQESRAKLIGGIAVAWLLGGFLEELVFRGVVLSSIESLLLGRSGAAPAAAVAVCGAAFGAGIVHLYQGTRAALIITQLSILFGVLFVVSGHNLWALILCHGFYDTIAFVRFANKKSKYSNLDEPVALES